MNAWPHHTTWGDAEKAFTLSVLRGHHSAQPLLGRYLGMKTGHLSSLFLRGKLHHSFPSAHSRTTTVCLENLGPIPS